MTAVDTGDFYLLLIQFDPGGGPCDLYAFEEYKLVSGKDTITVEQYGKITRWHLMDFRYVFTDLQFGDTFEVRDGDQGEVFWHFRDGKVLSRCGADIMELQKDKEAEEERLQAEKEKAEEDARPYGWMPF